MSGRDIIFLVDDPKWKKARGLVARLRRAAGEALAQSGLEGKSSLTVLLASDARLRALNRDFRGRDKPTNVLSFPAGPNDAPTGRTAGRKTASRQTGRSALLADAPVYRGDIALAYGVTAAEAKASGKSLSDHAAHLVVHGVLHLAGHDHERVRDAEKMESLEVRILGELGIADPYKSREPRPAARPKRVKS